jgi:predicted PurR-regulated permease PerM
MLAGAVQERVVRFRTSTVLAVLGITIAVALLLQIVWIARQVLTWVLIAVFLALAMNPAVEWFQAHGLKRRAVATAVVFLLVLAAIVGIGALFVPTLVDEVNKFADALPGYVDDLTAGRGPLGFLQDDYHVVDRVRDAVEQGGASRVLGLSGTAIAITKGVLTAIVAVVTIAFMTFFMLLEGPAWIERFYSLLPADRQERWRQIGRDIYRTVGGYVSGNLFISVIAGVASAVLLLVLGIPFAVALGLVVAILDLIPLAGATLAAIIVSTVAFLSEGWVKGAIVVAFFIVYQQLENHVIQPVVYSRTVQLSPLAILVAVLVGAELAGVLGALAAIPIAGTIQVVLVSWLRERRKQSAEPAAST